MSVKTSSKQSLARFSTLASASIITPAAAAAAAATVPVISQVYITDGSYATISQTALSPTGGYLKIIGSSFQAGSVVYVGGQTATVLATTFVSSTEIRVQVSALTVGNYSVMVFNTNSSGAIYANGIVVSSVPSWTTSSYTFAGNAVNTQLTATGDVPLTYSLQGGSSLPVGVTLSSTGLISGTAIGISTNTVVTFTVVVSDLQLQPTPQLINLTMTFYVGKLYTWGYNGDGRLGLNNTINTSSPVQVGSLTDWTATVNLLAAIKTDGTLWTRGPNTYGQLGQGDTLSRSSPVQVGTLTSWLRVAGGYNMGAIKTDRTLWVWGANFQGALGLGDTIHRSSPVQVGALTNWATVRVGVSCILATKTDGTLWTWGQNYRGTLGLGDSLPRSSPVQVGTLTNWLSLAAGHQVAAIKTDGTLWTWGFNSYGQLGLGDIIDRSSPIQVGLLTNWKSLDNSDGGRLEFLAIKTDNTLWAWGYNTSVLAEGKLGLGDTVSRSSPTQVGALTNWSTVTHGSKAVVAIKTNGTLWSWGIGQYGELGLGSTTNISSPQQVGSSTTWVAVSSSNLGCSAISS